MIKASQTAASCRPLILVAEDDPSHRFVLGRVFAAIGADARLQFVANGRELLDYLDGCRPAQGTAQGSTQGTAQQIAVASPNQWPHFVLLDLHMPKMGGIDTLKAIRADRSLRALPAIIFSSSDQPHHIDQAYASGANAYLVKVGDFKELVRHLRGLVAFWLQSARLPGASGIYHSGSRLSGTLS